MKIPYAFLFFCFLSLPLGCSSDDPEATTSTTSTGGGTNCSPSLGTSPEACPETAAAEGAWEAMRAACSLSDADFDEANQDDPTALTPDGAAKFCGSCECRQAAFDYYTQYKNCTASDDSVEGDNIAFSKKVYDLANGC